MKLPGKLRARVEEAFSRRLAEPLHAVQGDIGGIHDHLHRLERRLDDLAGRDRELDERIAEQARRVEQLERRMEPVERESSWSANELARLAPQAAAFEARLEQQRERAEVITAELTDLPEARTLVEVVREEHARVRARLSLVSSYEERLRRLELRSLGREGS
ncbi:hypothetical protein [Modestobacter lapidis]|nr:hypothetical protein [Modestobacter lapidis]